MRGSIGSGHAAVPSVLSAQVLIAIIDKIGMVSHNSLPEIVIPALSDT